MVIITRFIDENKIKKLKLPLLIYGRRKTGKTFLVKKLFKNSYYFFVKRNRTIFWENKKEILSYKELVRILELEKNKIIVIDEFHRLGEEFLDFLHIKQPQNIILVTSTLYLSKKMINKKSPILGLFLEYRLDLIDERDILINLKDLIKDKKELIEKSIFLREPILLKWYDLDLVDLINHLKLTVPALIGEIFLEENRVFSERYEGIIRAIASGKTSLAEITSYLFSRGIIDSQNPSSVKPYLSILLNLGILKRYKELKGKGYKYLIHSPLIDIYFYLDEKYNFSEENLDKKYLLEKIPFYVEDFFRNLLAKIYNYRIFSINKPDLEVDIVLGDFKRIKLVGEVKWKKDLSYNEIKNIEEKLKEFKNVKKVLIVLDKSELDYYPKNLEVLDVNNIINLVSKKEQI